MGYTNVAHYPEGKQGWMEAGLPVEKARLAYLEGCGKRGSVGGYSLLSKYFLRALLSGLAVLKVANGAVSLHSKNKRVFRYRQSWPSQDLGNSYRNRRRFTDRVPGVFFFSSLRLRLWQRCPKTFHLTRNRVARYA